MIKRPDQPTEGTPGEESAAITGEWVRTQRLDAHLTQQELADMAGLARNTICSIEMGGIITPRSGRRLRSALQPTNADLVNRVARLEAEVFSPEVA